VDTPAVSEDDTMYLYSAGEIKKISDIQFKAIELTA
jgi:hypothetical protein